MENLFFTVGAIIGGAMIGAFTGSFPLLFGLLRRRRLAGILSVTGSTLLGILLTAVLHEPAFLTALPAILSSLLILLIPKRS